MSTKNDEVWETWKALRIIVKTLPDVVAEFPQSHPVMSQVEFELWYNCLRYARHETWSQASKANNSNVPASKPA